MQQDYQKNFDRAANSRKAWLLAAERLETASKILRERFETIDLSNPAEIVKSEAQIDSVILMVESMRLECILKALWMHDEHPLARDGKYVGPKHHDLNKIANEALSRIDERLTDEESNLIRKLSRYNTGGRYPIGTQWDNNRVAVNSDGQAEGFLLSWTRPHDDDVLDALATRLTAKIA